MQGIVTDATTGLPLSHVTVVNVLTQQGTSTDDHGLYVITARQGDFVTFSYVGYLTIRRQKPPSVIIATQNITMDHSDVMLDEFRIRPGLTKYQLDSAERAEIYKVPMRRTHPSPIMSPASALAEVFSKKAKQTYEFQKVFINGELEKFIDTRYTHTLVTKMTGLTGDTMAYFMNAYPMPYDFARTATDLELKMWVRNNYKAWVKVTDTAALPGKKEDVKQ